MIFNRILKLLFGEDTDTKQGTAIVISTFIILLIVFVLVIIDFSIWSLKHPDAPSWTYIF